MTVAMHLHTRALEPCMHFVGLWILEKQISETEIKFNRFVKFKNNVLGHHGNYFLSKYTNILTHFGLYGYLRNIKKSRVYKGFKI